MIRYRLHVYRICPEGDRGPFPAPDHPVMVGASLPHSIHGYAVTSTQLRWLVDHYRGLGSPSARIAVVKRFGGDVRIDIGEWRLSIIGLEGVRHYGPSPYGGRHINRLSERVYLRLVHLYEHKELCPS